MKQKSSERVFNMFSLLLNDIFQPATPLIDGAVKINYRRFILEVRQEHRQAQFLLAHPVYHMRTSTDRFTSGLTYFSRSKCKSQNSCQQEVQLPQTWRVLSSIIHFYPNVTTLRSGLCCRRSVCLSSVCNVGAPYSGC